MPARRVIVVEHGGLGHGLEAFGAQAHDPGIGLQHGGNVAEIGADLVDGVGAVGVEAVALAVEGDDGVGQELREMLLHADGGAAEADAAMRGREGLVQVELAHVEAGVAGADDAEQAVAVGLVVGGEAAGPVHEIDELAQLRIEEAGILRAGEHDAGRALGERRLEGVELGVAMLAGEERDDLEAGDRGRGGIGRMREGGRDDLAAALELAARRHDRRG